MATKSDINTTINNIHKLYVRKSILGFLFMIIILMVAFFLLLVNCTTYTKDFDFNKISGCSYDENMPTFELAGISTYRAAVPSDAEINSELFCDNTYASILVNNETNECIVAHNPHKRVYPASMTKLVTALVVCDAINSGNIGLDDVVTVPGKVTFNESGVVASSLDKGCKITVRNLLSGLLIKSYNDFAVILAEYVAGSVDQFAELMNAKAYSIGATNSHFVNPHGLHNDDHYITAYDMYLIVSACHEYDIINEIDTYKSYSFTYINAAGNDVKVDITPTNQFLADNVELPSNIIIETWKTGTTNMAGRCLTMVTSIDQTEYSMVICDKVSPEDLYSSASKMFNLTK